MTDAQERIIVALDGTPDEARLWMQELSGAACWVKVGMTLFYAAGTTIIDELRTYGFRIFLDLKLHDIPNTVEFAAERLGRMGVDLLTVHALGGRAMMEAALHGARRGADAAGKAVPKVIAVTVLTSMNDECLREIGVPDSPAREVGRLTQLVKDARLDGIVCSPHEAASARSALGAAATIVTPGVRPAGDPKGDQSRIMTPAEALAAGASHLVVGRPVTQAPDRKRALLDIVASVP